MINIEQFDNLKHIYYVDHNLHIYRFSKPLFKIIDDKIYLDYFATLFELKDVFISEEDAETYKESILQKLACENRSNTNV